MNLFDPCPNSVGEVVGARSYQRNCALGTSLSVCSGDHDKHWGLSAVAVASWEARNWAAVVLTGRHQCKYRLVT